MTSKGPPVELESKIFWGGVAVIVMFCFGGPLAIAIAIWLE